MMKKLLILFLLSALANSVTYCSEKKSNIKHAIKVGNVLIIDCVEKCSEDFPKDSRKAARCAEMCALINMALLNDAQISDVKKTQDKDTWDL